ncbi:hypothetical protein MRX96_005980 [Rhipicephalus microplus]|uniref:uncharacterized protein LOC119160777 isoform X2 n=1 Tax=Rhipicephalus microplus TaxID=6941 RepID=UPI001888330D|nr:putative ribosome biogenesis protein slx9-like isoform X2 [Rhipicephalus microplus]
MGKVKVKPTESNVRNKAKIQLYPMPLIAGGLPNVQVGTSADQLGHRLGLASSAASTVTKKEKRKMRHEALVKKLEAGRVTKRKDRKKKARVLDMKKLMDALPTVAERKSSKAGTTRQKPRASMSFQVNKKLMAKDMKHLEELANHPQFRANPFDAVLNHLRQAFKR